MPETNALTFWYRDYSDGTGWDYPAEYTYVMVSTTTNATSAFTTTLWTGSYTTFTLTYQQASIDLSAYNGMDIYIAFKSYHTGGNYRIIDDVTGVNFAPATLPPDPASIVSPLNGATGVPFASTLNWSPGFGAPTDYDVYFGTTLPGTPTTNVTTTTWNPGTLAFNTTYYWKIVPHNANGWATGCPTWSFTTQSNPIATVPWFEGFESGFTQGQVIGSPYTQAGTNAQYWKANSTLTDYNRTPRTGAWNANIMYGCDEWLIRPIQLTGGVTYNFEMYARQDMTIQTTMEVKYGSTANYTEMLTSIVPVTTIVNGNYQLLSGAITPPTTGVYYIGMHGIMGGSPYYISIDDISVTVAASAPNPAVAISPLNGVTGVSIFSTLNWGSGGGAPTGYRLSFGTNNPPTNIVNNQDMAAALTYTPATLAYNTTYYWSVVAYNTYGNATTNTVQSFTTGGPAINMTNGSLTVPDGTVYSFFDSGGPTAQYLDNENYTFTFYPQPGHWIIANFTAFDSEAGWDYLKIYNGANTSAPQIGPVIGYNGLNALLGEVVATGALTFVFTTDGSGVRDGWTALISDAASADVPAGVDTPVNGITVNSTIDLTIDGSVTTTDPILLALPTYNPAGSIVLAFDGTGLGDLTITVPAGTWYLGLYDGTWHWSVPNPFVGPGTYTFIGVNYGAKADAIVLLTPVDPTLPVELSSFTAVLNADYYVSLSWVTESETGVSGFNVYRNESSDITNAVQVNPTLIPATNTSEQQTYSLQDVEVTTGTTYYYWLENVDMGGGSAMHGPQMVTVTGNPTPVLPEISMLNSAYPNPFRSGANTNINVSIKAGETGTVTVYNILGQTVKTFKVNEGTHTLKWDGKGCGSGVYFYRLTTPTTNSTKKLVVVK